MMDIKNIPGKLKTTCSFCVWKFEKRNGQKTKMPYNPATGERAKINDLRTFSDFKNTLVTYAMGGYDGIGIAVGNGIGAFDIDHCIREDGTLNDTADTVLSIFPTAYVEKSPSGKGLRGFFCVPEDYVYDKTVYYINNRNKGLEVYMPGATNRFVTVTGDVYRTGEIPNDETAMTTLLDTLMKRNKQVQQTHFQHHSYLDDDAVIAHANEASNSEKFKKLFAGDWEDLYGSQSDADMALLSILAFWCGCDEEQMDRIFRTSGLMRDKWDRKQAGSTYGAISIRNTVNTCSAVYMPVNAQDIVDEEFSKLDEDDYIEFQPDLTKITVTLEEMAPHTNARYGRNEIGMGNMFADYFKQIARYNSERKGWYVYDGSVWRPDKGNLKVSELAKLLADKLYVFALTITEEDARKRFIDRVRKLQLRKNRETMLRDAMSVYPISMQAFDRNKYFFNCKNGTLDMRTLEFREHRPEDYLTMESGITYDPEADCPRWHSFIKEVMCGDADLADFLQRSLGYALTGDTSQECMHGHLADDGSIYIFNADTEGLNFRKAFKDAGFYLSGCCIWKKNALVLGRSPYQWQHEPCLYGWKQKGKHQWYSDRKQTTIWEYDRPKSNKDHPTMKPIGLMSYPIRNSTMTNGIVLDPFLGSGSTLIACEETDRVCRGIELDPKFVDVIVKRYIEHSDGHYDDVFVVRDGQKLKFEEVATFEPEREVADGE